MSALDKLRDVDGFWYVSSPYSKYPGGHDAAFDDICDVCVRLALDGLKFFSPICHCHPIAASAGRRLNHYNWLALDAPVANAAYGLVVVMMQGWEDSEGVEAEIAWFKAAGKPIHYVSQDLTVIYG